MTAALRRNLHLAVTPAGGQMTSGSELPPPTVGGSPLISGGHAAPCPGGGSARDCATAALADAEAGNAAMTRMAKRTAGPHGFPAGRHQRAGVAERSPDLLTRACARPCQ